MPDSGKKSTFLGKSALFPFPWGNRIFTGLRDLLKKVTFFVLFPTGGIPLKTNTARYGTGTPAKTPCGTEIFGHGVDVPLEKNGFFLYFPPYVLLFFENRFFRGGAKK